MSKIGKKPIDIPAGISVSFDEKKNKVSVKGSKGELSFDVDFNIKIEIKDNQVVLFPKKETKKNNALWGLSRSLIANMVVGVEKGYEKQLELHIDHIDYKASQDDILYEILLKAGFELTTKIEKIKLAGKAVYSIEGGAMLICLEKELTKEVIKAMAEKQPSRVICLDLGFANNDQLKTNAVQIMKSKGIDDFRTV